MRTGKCSILEMDQGAPTVTDRWEETLTTGFKIRTLRIQSKET